MQVDCQAGDGVPAFAQGFLTFTQVSSRELARYNKVKVDQLIGDVSDMTKRRAGQEEKRLGAAGFRSRYLSHAKRAICQLIYSPDPHGYLRKAAVIIYTLVL
eukprot:6213025-Pleurochrysis_carterae.AAC.6